jgi:hypothetical protein
VLIVVASIVVYTVDLVTSASSQLTVPVTFPNSPWTLLIIMCRIENLALEWAGSISQVDA